MICIFNCILFNSITFNLTTTITGDDLTTSINYKNEPTFGLVNFPMLRKYYITGINNNSYLVENNKFKKLKVTKTNSPNDSKIAGNFFGWLTLDEQKKISRLTKLIRFPAF